MNEQNKVLQKPSVIFNSPEELRMYVRKPKIAYTIGEKDGVFTCLAVVVLPNGGNVGPIRISEKEYASLEDAEGDIFNFIKDPSIIPLPFFISSRMIPSQPRPNFSTGEYEIGLEGTIEFGNMSDPTYSIVVGNFLRSVPAADANAIYLELKQQDQLYLDGYNGQKKRLAESKAAEALEDTPL